MHNELVKGLLRKYYGEPKSSLIVGDRSEPEERTYYYSFEKEKQIAALRDVLGVKQAAGAIGRIPELRQSFPDSDDDEREPPRCVCLRERDGHWSAEFHKITGVVYRPTYGRRAEARLKLDDLPYASLSDRDGELYGFWRKIPTRKRAPYNERDGLSYWMNKALKTDEQFRGFAVDFIFAVAEAERRYILKDVARAISDCGCFLPPVSFKDLLTFRTPAELIHSLQAERPELNVDFNKVDLNVGYVMAMLAPEVDMTDWKVIAKLDPQKVSESVSLKTFYEGFSAGEFVKRYYRKVAETEGFHFDDRSYLEDYVDMCLEAGEKLRIGLTVEGLIRAHDRLSARNRLKAAKELDDKPLVPAPSRFDELEKAIAESGNAGFERIRTPERLLSEGEYQRNCVFTRRSLLKKDSVAIFHWDHEGESYTIQFRRDRKKRYYVDEVRARFNRQITPEHLKYLKEALSGISDVDSEDELPYPEDNYIEYEAMILREEAMNEARLWDDMQDNDIPF